MKRIRLVLIWMIGLSFIVVGLLKYTAPEEDLTEPIFEQAHYPRWFFYVVGTIELLGGILLLMTATTSKRIGSILIGIVMLGALVTRYIINDHYTHFILPGIIFLMAVLTTFDFETKERPN